MKVLIEKGKACGTVNAPPSKSMAHRLLILAGLSGKECRVHGIAESEDILATIDCLRALGAEIALEGEVAHVRGIDLRAGSQERQAGEKAESVTELKSEMCANDELRLYARESGSTLRFMIPIALLTGKMVHIGGSKRLLERPQSVYEELFAKENIIFEKNENEIKVCGKLKSGGYELDGDVSSQFVTGLLLALPLLDGDSTIVLRPPVESRSYIDMTLEALAMFGAEADWQNENTLYIKGGQNYEPQGGSMDVTVEGDYSNAAFFEALNYVNSEPASVAITGLSSSSRQADRVYRNLFGSLKSATGNTGTNRGNGGCMEADGSIDISDCPDLGPILFAVAAALGGGHFTGTRRLKIKESDRAAAMATELAKFGVHTEVGENEVIVSAGTGLKSPTAELDGHNDHRIVMSLAVLCTLTGGVINGAEAVAKSFPDFFDRLESLGIEVKRLDN